MRQKHICLALMGGYVFFLFCIALFIRETGDKSLISTDWFWGYKSKDVNILYWDNLYNILLFVPIGLIAGYYLPKYKLLGSFLFGLFISETIECSQLIWKRGTFDVDDLFNNTTGALIGCLVSVVFLKVRNRVG